MIVAKEKEKVYMKKVAEFLLTVAKKEEVDMDKVLKTMKKIKDLKPKWDMGPENFEINDRSLHQDMWVSIEFPGGYLKTKPNQITVEISHEGGDFVRKNYKYKFTGTSADVAFVKKIIKETVTKAKGLEKKWGLKS